MRIIGGRLKGIRIEPTKGLPVRPTTDKAKEALFNILNFRIDWDKTQALDLFSGTGNMAIEMASRGAASVESVEIHGKCCRFIHSMAEKYELPIQVKKADVFRYIQKTPQSQFDLIFADPPYQDPRIGTLSEQILHSGLLKPEGLLILEHPSTLVLQGKHLPFEQRKYGHSMFSFYKLV